MTYYGILDDGNVIPKAKLEDLVQIPKIKYYLKCETASYNHYSFTLVHADGQLNLLRIGDFELFNIDSEIYVKTRNRHEATLTIFEHRVGHTIEIRIETNGNPKLVIAGITGILNKLNELGSYQMYQQSLEFENLKQENVILKEKIRSLEASLQN